MGCHEKCHEKFCYIRTRDVQKHYYGVVLLKLLYTLRIAVVSLQQSTAGWRARVSRLQVIARLLTTAES